MKNKFSILIFYLSILFLISCTKPLEFKGTFSTDPEEPKAGEKVMVKYNSDETVLKDAEKIKMFVYQYDVDIESSSEYEMQKVKNGWTGEFIILPETKGTIIIFAEGETQDNNDEKGYFIKIYDDNGKVLAGFYGGLGAARYNWGRNIGVARDIKESISNFKKEFEANPENKYKYFDFYFPVLIADNETNANGIIEAELAELEKTKNKNEEELSTLAKWYLQIGNEAKGKEYENLVLEKYPKGKYAEDKLVNELNNEKNINKKKNC